MSQSWKARRIAAWALALVIALGTFAFRYLSFREFGNDHFVHLAQAQQIVKGSLPVRDYVERGIPLMAAASAAAQFGMGEGLRAEVLLVGAAYAVAAGITLLLATTVSQSLLIGLLASLPPIVIFPVSYAYPKLLIYALWFAAVLAYGAKPTWPRTVGMAAVIAVAFLFRHDHGIVLAFVSVAVMAARHGVTRAGVSALGRVGGLALLLVGPYLLWVQSYQGVGEYLRQGMAFSRREAERGDGSWSPPPVELDWSRPFLTRLARGPVIHVRWQASPEAINAGETRHGLIRLDPAGPQTWQYEMRAWSSVDLERLVRDPDVADTYDIDRSTLALQVPSPQGLDALLFHLPGPGDGLRLRVNGVAVWFYLVWALPLMAAVVLAVGWRAVAPSLRVLITAAIVTQVAMNVLMLRDPLDTRIRDVLVPSVVLLSFLARRAWRASGAWPARAARRLLVSGALVALVVVSAAVGEAGERLERTGAGAGVEGVRVRLRELRRVVLPASRRTGRLGDYQPIVDYLDRCTTPSSRILGLTFAPEVFFYSGRAFAGGQVTLTPGYFVTEADADLMLDRLAGEDVPLVILDSDSREEVALDYPRVMGYVHDRYREVGSLPLRGDTRLILLAETSRTPAGRFGSSELPCFVP
jgi:hypothetical protein